MTETISDTPHAGRYVPKSFGPMPAPMTPHPVASVMSATDVRTFTTGATRNTDTDKLDYEGFLSPLVLQSYARYMSKNRLQADGSLRSSDNWQRGIPRDVYIKSLLRHVMDVWLIHDGHEAVSPETGQPVDLEEVLAAVMFNAMGLLYEILRAKP